MDSHSYDKKEANFLSRREDVTLGSSPQKPSLRELCKTRVLLVGKDGHQDNETGSENPMNKRLES